MNDRHERLLEYLAQSDRAVTATELADVLGVTTRSVRSYVTAIKSHAHPVEPIESSANGYSINRDALSAYRSASAKRPHEPETPRDRLYHIVRRLGSEPEGIEFSSLASSLFVSESTLEHDLRKIKALVESEDLVLVRRDNMVMLRGAESNHRHLLSRLFREESANGFLELERVQAEFASTGLTEFKTDLIALLDSRGFFVNEYGLNNVLLHLAIAVERTNLNQTLGGEATIGNAELDQLAADLNRLVTAHFSVELSPTDLDYLALLVTTRVVTPGHDQNVQAVAEAYVKRDDLDSIRHIVAQVREQYLVDLDDDEFIVRLSLHVQNLIARAADNAYSPNPLTRSIKTSYPMTYELSVFIASRIQEAEGIIINDDEIAYIALHVGSYLERAALRARRLSATLVTPNYYDLHVTLQRSIESALGDDIEVTNVITRTDVPWENITTDLVLTTIAPRVPTEQTVSIQPFLTEGDIEAIRRAIVRHRRQARRAQIKDELLKYFDESLYFRNVSASDEFELINTLGTELISQGIVDQSYVDAALDRERMSSTAFTETIAVPHAMTMSATRTAIAIVVNETPMSWGENRVNVIAFIAFSAAGRSSFQDVFDQFVEVFAERSDVQKLVKRADTFQHFIDELVHLIDQ